MKKKIKWTNHKVIRKREIEVLKNVKVYGVDTETLNGEPHSLQVYGDKHEHFTWTNKDNATEHFFVALGDIFHYCDNAIIYGFNLRFDLPILFWKYYKEFVTTEHFILHDNGFKITILYAQNCFAIIESGNKRAYIIDVRNFFRSGSLDNLAEKFKLGIRKIEKPLGLGEIPLTNKDIPYAMRDAEIAYKLGLIIRESDEQFNLDVSFSCAGLAEEIFRSQFIENDIELPDKAIVGAALNSYHGGRNWYKYNEPVIVKNCYEFDLKSAYAWAMTQLPDFSKGKWIWTDNFNSNWKYSICKVTFKPFLPPNLCFLDDGTYAVGNASCWLTYPEVVAVALQGSYIEKIEKQVAYIPSLPSYNSPTRKFVETFWQLRKQAIDAKDDVKSEMYKLIMNSLYGKFIQTIAKNKRYILTPDGRIEIKVDWIAGGLFHPFIATLITGMVRGKLLTTENESFAFHSSTDSVKTENKIKTGDRLGCWEEKVFGDTIVLRNRLYIHYDKNGKLAKAALHGFRGKPETLEKAIYDGNNEITTKRILWPKEANRRKLQALKMIEYKQKISIDFTEDFVYSARKIIDKNKERRENEIN